MEPILQTVSQFGLLSATRQHEAGITSNRGSACRGEYSSRVLYTPPVKSWELGLPEAGVLTSNGGSRPR